METIPIYLAIPYFGGYGLSHVIMGDMLMHTVLDMEKYRTNTKTFLPLISEQLKT